MSARQESPSLEHLLSIWPIAESFASSTSAGDLINLSRTSSDLRASLHGGYPKGKRRNQASFDRSTSQLCPVIGRHQTSNWTHLKQLTSFTCSSKIHTKGFKTRACVFCALPICEACIVKDSFKHRGENTFKNRLRHLCPDCWQEGRAPKHFHYPVREASASSSEDVFCQCSLKDNGWLCLDCKRQQNTSAPSLQPQPNGDEQLCYGYGCTNTVDLSAPDRDHRRVCLWCEKPARRQYTGEDRYAWNSKIIEKRAINAESRSRDIEEYHRIRNRNLRMSRREMRGAKGPDNDKLDLVRHLDTINYRSYMAESATPSPETVWKSKKGIWRYEAEFFDAVFQRLRHSKFTALPHATLSSIRAITQENALPFARTNLEVTEAADYTGHFWCFKSRQQRAEFVQLRTRILDLCLAANSSDYESVARKVSAVVNYEYGVKTNTAAIEKLLVMWANPTDTTASSKSSGNATNVKNDTYPDTDADADSDAETLADVNALAGQKDKFKVEGNSEDEDEDEDANEQDASTPDIGIDLDTQSESDASIEKGCRIDPLFVRYDMSGGPPPPPPSSSPPPFASLLPPPLPPTPPLAVPILAPAPPPAVNEHDNDDHDNDAEDEDEGTDEHDDEHDSASSTDYYSNPDSDLDSDSDLSAWTRIRTPPSAHTQTAATLLMPTTTMTTPTTMTTTTTTPT